MACGAIRVNGISPGPIRANSGEHTYRRGREAATSDLGMPEHVPPLGVRPAGPIGLAEFFLYRVFDASRLVTGMEMLIDAGMTPLHG